MAGFRPSPRRVMTMTDAGLGNRIKVSSPKRVWVGSWVGAWVGSWVGAARIRGHLLAYLPTYSLLRGQVFLTT